MLMNPFFLIMLAFIAVPIAEIYVLIEVGGRIGVLNTIGFVILTAVVGAALVRSQGLATLARVQNAINDPAGPGTVLIEGALILFAGALLLTPGFLTDGLGFFLLLPPSRAWLASGIAKRAVVMASAGMQGRPGFHPGPGATRQGSAQGGVIDGEYTRDPPNKQP